MLDDCNFHQSVSLDKFESERLLELMPPDGEFAVMNYRSTYPFKPPFRVQTTIEDDPNTALKVSHASPGSRLGAIVEKSCHEPYTVHQHLSLSWRRRQGRG